MGAPLSDGLCAEPAFFSSDRKVEVEGRRVRNRKNLGFAPERE